MEANNREKVLALVAAFAAVVLWAFAFPASRAALAYFSVEEVALYRHVIASLFYLGFLFAGRFSLPNKSDLKFILILGLLGITTYQMLFVFGMGKVQGGAASMIITANPVVVALLARFFLSEKLSTPAWLGIGLSIAGVAIISLLKGTDGEPAGYIALIIAVFSIAIYFTFQKPFFARYSPLAMTSYTCIAGTLPMLFFLPGTLTSMSNAPLGPHMWIIAMGILSSGVGFYLWFYALSKLKAGVVTSFLFLQPLFVASLSYFWLDEVPEAKTLIGGLVVLAGLALILKAQRAESKKA